MGSSNLTYTTNPYALFDQSQWSNPYSQFNNQAMPWPSQVVPGWPTDAMGNPIGGGPQANPGMTINQTPAQPAAPAPQIPNLYNQPGANAALANQLASLTAQGMGGAPSMQAENYRALSGGGGMNIPGMSQLNAAYNMGQALNKQATGGLGPIGSGAAQAGPAQAAAQPGPSQPQLTRAQYLSLLANPGNPANVGATVPQATQARNDPSVMQQFLANWKPAQSGPNSGFQQSFASALKGLGY